MYKLTTQEQDFIMSAALIYRTQDDPKTGGAVPFGTFSSGVWLRTQGSACSWATNCRSSLTVSWLGDFPPPERYLERQRPEAVAWGHGRQPQQAPREATRRPAVHRAHLVCLLPLSSCWATEAHFSASCVTKRRWRRRSLSGNFFISDSSIKALKLTRPRNKEKFTFSVINIYEALVWNTEGEVWFYQLLSMDICNALPL